MLAFAYTILYVADVTETISFYQRAFGFMQKFIAPGNEYAELNTGSTTLSFAATTLAQQNIPSGFIESAAGEKPFGIEIGFTTHNVDAAYNKAIKEGATSVMEPTVKPWGQTVSYVRDMNGFLIELCTPMG